MKSLYVAISATLLVLSSHSLAVTSKQGSAQFPESSAIEREMQRQKEIITQSINVESAPENHIPDVSSDGFVIDVGTPASTTDQKRSKPIKNILAFAESIQPKNGNDMVGLGVNGMTGDTEEFVVFLSTSLPDAVIKPLIEQAAEAKAKVVFRGTPSKDLNWRTLQTYLLGLNLSKAPSIDINPTLFKRYDISVVPSFAIGKYGIITESDANGCLPPDQFLTISGDISVVYALNQFDKKASAELKPIARRHLF